MTSEMPTKFLRRLIAIGESGSFGSLEELFAEFPPERVGHFMRQHWDFWNSLTDSLSETEHESLIRALTVAERDYPAFGGGSVSGVIWAFRRLQQRTQSGLEVLADWILAHTNNDNVPFGTTNLGARSLAEYSIRKQERAGARDARQRAESQRQSAAAARVSDKATRDLFPAIRRKDGKAVQALLLRGARLDVPDASGQTALAYAESLGNTDIAEILQAHASGIRPEA
jgi:hypothetical protein